MSGARRKSKYPQKWEESHDDDQIKPNTDFSSNCSSDPYKESKPTYKLIKQCNSSEISEVGANDEKYTSNPQYRPINKLSKPKLNDASSEEEDVEKKSSEGEMTVLDVLQGSRQGLVAECKACSIQLKDWNSTISHIHSHRLVFIPSCVKDSGNASTMQNVNCQLCQKVCQNISVLAFHAHTEHSLTKAPFVCPFCGKLFQSSALIQKHIDIQDVCMKCPVCSATYNQEYKLYAHLSDCLPTFHPHLKSLTCHVCKRRVPMNFLADHMINHSVQGHEVRQTKPRRKSGSSPQQLRRIAKEEAVSCLFLCEICDGRFSCFDDFRKHLIDHTETKMFCPLCFLKGFEKMSFIVRHLILRCPRRTRDQIEFGYVLSLIGKEQKLNFLQVIREIHHLQPFRERLQSWSSVQLIQELLTSVSALRREDLRDASLPTDMDLLLWLSEFEKEMQKSQNDNWITQQDLKSHHPHHLSVPPKDLNEAECTLLMKNIQDGFNKVERNHESSVSDALSNAHMTIRPATVHETNYINSQNESLSQRPSPEHIRKTCPGAVLLHDVDVKRLQSLHDEAVSQMEKDFLAEHIQRGLYTAHDFIRLEWEAQYLRSKQPFYLAQKEDRRRFSPLYKKPALLQGPSADIDPVTLKRIQKELEAQNEEVAQRFANSPRMHHSIDQKTLDILVEEAKKY